MSSENEIIKSGHLRGQRFMQLYLAHERRLYGFLMSMVPNWADVDELKQEVAAIMWNKFDNFEEGTDFNAWALTIARYQIMNYRKKKKNQRLRFNDEILESIESKAEKATESVDYRSEALHICVDNLKDKEKQLLNLRYEPDHDTAEIANRVSRTVPAVYKALNRIHAKLLECIKRRLSIE
ncbi:MAG: sigma-70 family RNA polymerase sigma factor [Phycisphaerae bacterium]|nr:sigma-70 family RNA polymerase sigma factor [Phycisphaerae bacterium]